MRPPYLASLGTNSRQYPGRSACTPYATCRSAATPTNSSAVPPVRSRYAANSVTARAANQHLSDELKAMLTAWFTQGDMVAATERHAPLAYAPMSWHCIFAGYGTFPAPAKLRPLPEAAKSADAAAIAAMLDACASHFAPL